MHWNDLRENNVDFTKQGNAYDVVIDWLLLTSRIFWSFENKDELRDISR